MAESEGITLTDVEQRLGESRREEEEEEDW